MNRVVAFARLERRVVDHVLEERNVGLHAADAELAQGAVHALAGFREVSAPARDLHEQRIVVRRDHRAAVGRCPVEPDAEAGGRTVGVDLAVIGDEVVRGVFGRHAALEGEAVERDLVLRGAGASAAPCSSCPWATRICERTMSMPVTTSVTVCSTWMRGFISMKNHSSVSTSTRNSTVPALS